MAMKSTKLSPCFLMKRISVSGCHHQRCDFSEEEFERFLATGLQM
jgi:hypothetical protein